MIVPYSEPGPGAYVMVPNEVYHSWKYASSTALRTLMKASPAHAAAGIIDSSSPSLRLGTAVHAMVLEPSNYQSLIRVEPKVDKRTKEGKQLWESFQWSLMPGQTTITEEQAAIVQAIGSNVEFSSACSTLLREAAQREYSIVAEVEGVMCKCRCDAYGHGLVVDVKTTSGLASNDEFSKSMWNFGYGIQAAFYRMVLRAANMRADRFAWIVCETNAPYGVACYEIEGETLDYFEPAISAALYRWSDCETKGNWPSYPDRVERLNLPTWMQQQLQGEP